MSYRSYSPPLIPSPLSSHSMSYRSYSPQLIPPPPLSEPQSLSWLSLHTQNLQNSRSQHHVQTKYRRYLFSHNHSIQDYHQTSTSLQILSWCSIQIYFDQNLTRPQTCSQNSQHSPHPNSPHHRWTRLHPRMCISWWSPRMCPNVQYHFHQTTQHLWRCVACLSMPRSRSKMRGHHWMNLHHEMPTSSYLHSQHSNYGSCRNESWRRYKMFLRQTSRSQHSIFLHPP